MPGTCLFVRAILVRASTLQKKAQPPIKTGGPICIFYLFTVFKLYKYISLI